jgi:hypothetical protein
MNHHVLINGVVMEMLVSCEPRSNFGSYLLADLAGPGLKRRSGHPCLDSCSENSGTKPSEPGLLDGPELVSTTSEDLPPTRNWRSGHTARTGHGLTLETGGPSSWTIVDACRPPELLLRLLPEALVAGRDPWSAVDN